MRDYCSIFTVERKINERFFFPRSSSSTRARTLAICFSCSSKQEHLNLHRKWRCQRMTTSYSLERSFGWQKEKTSNVNMFNLHWRIFCFFFFSGFFFSFCLGFFFSFLVTPIDRKQDRRRSRNDSLFVRSFVNHANHLRQDLKTPFFPLSLSCMCSFLFDRRTSSTSEMFSW